MNVLLCRPCDLDDLRFRKTYHKDRQEHLRKVRKDFISTRQLSSAF